MREHHQIEHREVDVDVRLHRPVLDCCGDRVAHRRRRLHLELLDLVPTLGVERPALPIRQHDGVPILVDDPRILPETGDELFDGVVAREVHRWLQLIAELLQDVDDRGEEDVLFRPEVLVEQSDADLRLVGERLHRHLVKPGALHDGDGGVEQLSST